MLQAFQFILMLAVAGAIIAIIAAFFRIIIITVLDLEKRRAALKSNKKLADHLQNEKRKKLSAVTTRAQMKVNKQRFLETETVNN